MCLFLYNVRLFSIPFTVFVFLVIVVCMPLVDMIYSLHALLLFSYSSICFMSYILNLVYFQLNPYTIWGGLFLNAFSITPHPFHLIHVLIISLLHLIHFPYILSQNVHLYRRIPYFVYALVRADIIPSVFTQTPT